MKTLTRQSSASVALSLATVAATPWLPASSSDALLLCLLALILLLGVPHGALDTLYASRQFRLQHPLHWLVFGFGYLAPALLVVLLWLYSPALFLFGFLAISALHFSGDLQPETPWWVRSLYGAAIITLPALLHADELSRLLGFLVPPAIAATATDLLRALALPWLLGLLAASVWIFDSSPRTATELFALTLLGLIAPPLVAFTVFFCAMHSARHILRSAQLTGAPSLVSLLKPASIPMAGTLVASGLAFLFFPATSLEGRLMQTIFVILAALTVPHMALVERIRLGGWRFPVHH